MMWDDIGFLVSKNRYNENSLISEIYTMEHGKVSGIIFGGTSKRIKNYLQIGNKLHVNYTSKSENKIGYFKIEIDQILSPLYFDNQQKLACIISAMNLIKILNAEAQKNKYIYILIENFYKILKSENWIKNYIFWELDLFKSLGFDLRFENLVEKKIRGNMHEYYTKSNGDPKLVPSFLIDRNDENVNLEILLNGLKLVGNYLEKTILKPNNLTQPLSRIQFISSLK